MHEDDRGKIQDLLVGDGYSVTLVTFKKGAVRGNHYHKKTIQHDIILKGKLFCKVKSGSYEKTYRLRAGQQITHEQGLAHAYEAREDAELVTICVGTRIGPDYSLDTYKLKKPLLPLP